MENSDYICEAELKSEHGWTNSLIRDHFGEPEMTLPNPRCPSGRRRIKLYSRKKVKGIESDPDFQEDLCKSRKRSEAHKKNHECNWACC